MRKDWSLWMESEILELEVMEDRSTLEYVLCVAEKGKREREQGG